MVITNYKFENEIEDLPPGNDIEEIKALFSPHGYTVVGLRNLNKRKLLKKVRCYSRMNDSGSLICFLSSHGDQTSLACPNGDDVEINDILKAANTDQLRNLPKVFFIDACRSKITGSVEGKVVPETPDKDYYIGFSCLDLETSFTGSRSCGRYFQELIKVFKDGFQRKPREDETVRDINHFLTKVHNIMHTKYKQVSTVRTSLSGKVFLHKQAIELDQKKKRNYMS